MKAIWLEHLKEPIQRAEYEAALRNGYNTVIISRLKQIIAKRRLENSTAELKLDNYDSPNWSHKQAHTNGMNQALKWIEDLLNFEN